MTIHTVKRVAVLFLVNHLYAGTRCFERKRKLLNSIGYELGEDTKVVGPIFCTGKLTVGEKSWIGRNLTIHGNGAVIIGTNCDIAPDVTFLTGGHAIGTSERRAGAGENYTICIEDGCWIGARTTFLNSITVGKGSIIGACACVNRDVPSNTLAAGAPAREIRTLYETKSSDE